MNNQLISCDATHRLRAKVLVGMCAILGSTALLFGLINLFYYGERATLLGIIELGYFVICFTMLQHVKKQVQPNWFLAFHCFVLTLLICFGTYISRIESSVYLWAVVLPTVFYLGLGLKIGFIWSFICLCLQLMVLHFAFDGFDSSNAALLLNLSMAYIFVWTISHVYEDSRAKGVDRLNNLAHRDALTGAQNRLSLITVFKQSPNKLQGCIVYILDLDDFKEINDRYGHAAGDEVLKQVVIRLSQVVNEQQIYRMGGEEFVVVLTPHQVQQTGLFALVKQLQTCVMTEPVIFQGESIAISFSAGLEHFNRHVGLDQTLSKADKELYLAKNSGKGRCFYQGQAVQ
ncbi:GGDEF domain-containing protein [Vibrio sp. JPW-9-11-11]|uniref:GGDEF domain-containing protein n=1 Tax=Vibrio sp. JPW-9-11-11 TaxID=1416532 RepID=UPI001592C422|nr:GGDEF domain-containing protein [Vibrio sp. JPW-9-11-11]NVD06301.1 GGDEF domain-containing protein [Vibrio sp. JPW-9-11-11]